MHSCKNSTPSSGQAHGSFLGGSCYILAFSAAQEAQVFVKQQPKSASEIALQNVAVVSVTPAGGVTVVGLNLPDAVTL